MQRAGNVNNLTKLQKKSYYTVSIILKSDLPIPWLGVHKNADGHDPRFEQKNKETLSERVQ